MSQAVASNPPLAPPRDRPLPALLFTAFEPSGDDHASAVIAELRRRYPDLPMYAWGGPKMERAGATLIERTGDEAVMGVPGLKKIIEHHNINARIDAWLRTHPVAVHLPVDAPSANTPICEIARRHGCKVVHIVAPQIWAWGRWRIHKLRRITDLVLCMFPFEEVFFHRRRVPAEFIGHFLFDKPLDEHALDARAAHYMGGHPRIAMMPGSRPTELERNLPILLDAFNALKRRHPGASGIMAATSEAVAQRLRSMAQRTHAHWPDSIAIRVQETDAIIRWCDIALVKSGTVTLQVAKQNKPMVVFYKKSNPLFFLLARTMLSTKLFSLPNVIARRRIVPEFIPHFGGAAPIVNAADELLTDPAAADRQRRDLAAVVGPLDHGGAARHAADTIEKIAGIVPAR